MPPFIEKLQKIYFSKLSSIVIPQNESAKPGFNRLFKPLGHLVLISFILILLPQIKLPYYFYAIWAVLILAGYFLIAGVLRDSFPFQGLLVKTFSFLGCAYFALIFLPIGQWLCTPLMVTPKLEKADAIVCLASGFYDDGSLSSSAKDRILHSVSLFRMGLAPKIFFSTSRDVKKSGYREADGTASLAHLLQLSDRDFEILKEGTTTFSEGRVISRLLLPQSIRRILLVTNGPHIFRASLTFQKAGFEVLPAPVHTTKSIESSMPKYCLFEYAVHEYLGLISYWVRGFI